MTNLASLMVLVRFSDLDSGLLFGPPCRLVIPKFANSSWVRLFNRNGCKVVLTVVIRVCFAHVDGWSK